MTLVKFKSQIEKIAEGCGNWDNTTLVEFSRQCDKEVLCSICQTKLRATLQTKKESCEDELEFFETTNLLDLEKRMNDKEDVVDKRIKELQQIIAFCEKKLK